MMLNFPVIKNTWPLVDKIRILFYGILIKNKFLKVLMVIKIE